MSLFVGTVIGTAMQKTAKVVVNRMFLHPHVLKYISRRKVVFADNRGGCIVGDVVLLKSCQPISKKKHYTIHEVVAHAPRYVAPPTEDADLGDGTEDKMATDTDTDAGESGEQLCTAQSLDSSSTSVGDMDTNNKTDMNVTNS